MRDKITLFVMGYKGHHVLLSLVQQFGVGLFDKVVYATDKNVLNDYSQDIISTCQQYNIAYVNRLDSFVIHTKYSIAISWRWLINVDGDKKLIVCHDSLLPAYRGFAPLVTALINGDSTIGVTALFADAEYDRGEIISQKSIDIKYPIKISTAIEAISGLYAGLCAGIAESIVSSVPLKSYVQDESKATYSLWRDADDYLINWHDDATCIERFINAVGYPFTGAVTRIKDEVIVITEATACEDVHVVNRTPGKVLFIENGCPIVVCGKGLLKINQAHYKSNSNSILPLVKFRVRFG